MKTTSQILLQLVPGQASTDVLAEALHQPRKVIEAFCSDLETDGLVERGTIRETITTWNMTDAGREVARSLPTLTTAGK